MDETVDAEPGEETRVRQTLRSFEIPYFSVRTVGELREEDEDQRPG